MKSKILIISVISIVFCVFSIMGLGCTGGSATAASAEKSTEDAGEESGGQKKADAPLSDDIKIDGVIGEGEYDFYMSEDGTGMDLNFHFDDNYLYMGIINDVSGWTSIGLDPEFAMQGADIIFMSIDGGEVVMRDDFGTDVYSHSSDEKLGGTFDIVEYAGSEDGGKVIFEFAKPLDSGDEFDKVIVPGNVYQIILAENADSSDFDRGHTKRGTSQLQLQ